MWQKGNIQANGKLDSNAPLSNLFGRSPPMRFAAAVLAAWVVLSLTSLAEAAGPRRMGAHNKHAAAGTYNKQAALGAYGKAVYPKYYWGFHSRTLQNIGVPHGDIGIRGSDLSMGPW
jgi:hypothetical protein